MGVGDVYTDETVFGTVTVAEMPTETEDLEDRLSPTGGIPTPLEG